MSLVCTDYKWMYVIDVIVLMICIIVLSTEISAPYILFLDGKACALLQMTCLRLSHDVMLLCR